MNATIAPHLAYLNDAAHLLLQSSPESSAWLMSRRNELMFENDLELTDTQRQHVCGACGHIMLLGQNSTMNLETDEALRRKKVASAVRHPKSSDKHGTTPMPKKVQQPKIDRAGARKSIECNQCKSVTTTSLPPPPAKITKNQILGMKKHHQSRGAGVAHRGPPSTASNTNKPGAGFGSGSGSGSGASLGPASANASSKKRAKSRKAGLQAMLSQAQSAKGSRNLSLADFARK